MPQYIYKNPDKEDYIEVIQTMNEKHVYFDERGLEWKRVYTNPQLNTNGSIDPFNSKQFVEKTGKMKGTYGDMLNYSNELSKERAKSTGQDPVKESYYKEYSKQRGGKHHPDKMKKSAENDFVKIDL